MTGLPKPLITATIDPPTGGPHALGRVTIDGDPPVVRPKGGEVGRTNRLLRCTACKQPGHARSNRTFHPRST